MGLLHLAPTYEKLLKASKRSETALLQEFTNIHSTTCKGLGHAFQRRNVKEHSALFYLIHSDCVHLKDMVATIKFLL